MAEIPEEKTKHKHLLIGQGGTSCLLCLPKATEVGKWLVKVYVSISVILGHSSSAENPPKMLNTGVSLGKMVVLCSHTLPSLHKEKHSYPLYQPDKKHVPPCYCSSSLCWTVPTPFTSPSSAVEKQKGEKYGVGPGERVPANCPAKYFSLTPKAVAPRQNQDAHICPLSLLPWVTQPILTPGLT